MTDDRRSAPAALRNRDPILAVLREVLPAHGLVLEIASGTGEHVVHFARHLPNLVFQPSDPDAGARASVTAWIAESGLANVRAPLMLDAASPPWPVTAADAIVCINMIHISPWRSTEGLFAGAAAVLPAGAPLALYGPYRRHGVPTAPSNEEFDISLRARDPAWGLRQLDDVAALAEQSGFALDRVVEMPANNLTVVFRKD
jgi:cyclopropane fatty-acyl-phospholipid synthase-like methyltransferase